MKILEDIYELLKKYYGYTSFRNGQENIINNILSERDILAVMPTGAGKSICYQIPALAFDGITIVISPLISLMQDQVRSLVSVGVKAAYLNSSLTPRQMDMAIQNALKGIYKIIYVAPERLTTDSFIEFGSSRKISLVAVDEAHCISQWGHDFRPSYMQISSFINKLPHRPVIAAFTATATERVKNDIVNNLNLSNPFMLTTGFDRKNLYFGTYKPLDKNQFVLNYIERNKDKSGIIYCSTRKSVDEVSQMLVQSGYKALPYHAGMTDGDRIFNQNEFIYDRTKIIVATNAFGMGIDKPNVRYVLHYNMPRNMEEYYQQAGRAGRDGEPSECILLYSSRDVKVNEFLINKSAENENMTNIEKERFIQSELEKLRLMTFYSTSKTVCLRKRMLGYFGESFSAPCDNCSVCNGDGASRYSPHIVVTSDSKAIYVDEALLGRLNSLRSSLGVRLGIPAFAVLNDATLRELAAFKPRSISELSKISGLGESKTKRYGQNFIDIIVQYENEADF